MKTKGQMKYSTTGSVTITYTERLIQCIVVCQYTKYLLGIVYLCIGGLAR